MKTFSKTFLPDEITHNGQVYKLNVAISTARTLNNTSLSFIQNSLKKEGRSAVLVKVLPMSLKGKSDLWGNPYKPNEHIFTT